MTDPSAAEKLAALSERLKGAQLFSLLGVSGKPSAEVLEKRIADLRSVVYDLCSHLPENDKTRADALARLKSVERLVSDPLEWHVMSRAEEMKLDAADPAVRTTIENSFFEEHVPRTVWLNAPRDGGHSELRRSMRLPLLVEVDVDAGAGPTRMHAENVSRDGLCLDVPASFNATTVKLVLTLPNVQRQVSASGAVVWRQTGRVGIQFAPLAPAEQNVLDAALQAHFEALRSVTERWLALAPKNPAAIASAALVGYYASALPSERRPYLDKLTEAADGEHRPSAEVQIALAKLRMEEGDLEGAELCLKRVDQAARTDARWQLLDQTLTKMRKGGATLKRRDAGRGTNAKAAMLALLMIGFFGAVTVALMSFGGPYEDVDVPAGGLPCERAQLLEVNVLCYMTPARFGAITPADRKRLADDTLSAFAGRGASYVTIVDASNDVVLELYDPGAAAN